MIGTVAPSALPSTSLLDSNLAAPRISLFFAAPLRPKAYAGIAQLVERNLAKVEVASSSLVSRSSFTTNPGTRPGVRALGHWTTFVPSFAA